MKLRLAQLNIALAAGLHASDLFFDGVLLRDLWLQGRLLPFAIYALIALGASTVEAWQLKEWRTPWRGLCRVLRVQPYVELAMALVRPSYHTLHPSFLLPIVVFLDATLKAIPQSLFQAYRACDEGNSNSHSASGDGGESGFVMTPALVAGLSMCGAHLSIAWALVTYEMGDFKQRQVLLPESFVSTRWLALLLYRTCEVTQRVLSVALLAVALPQLLTVLTLADLALLLVAAPRAWAFVRTSLSSWATFSSSLSSSLPSLSSFARSSSATSSSSSGGNVEWWKLAIFYFVFWHTSSPSAHSKKTMSSSSNPMAATATSSSASSSASLLVRRPQNLVEPTTYFVIRTFGAALILSACLAFADNLDTLPMSLLWATGASTVLTAALFPYVHAQHWRSTTIPGRSSGSAGDGGATKATKKATSRHHSLEGVVPAAPHLPSPATFQRTLHPTSENYNSYNNPTAAAAATPGLRVSNRAAFSQQQPRFGPPLRMPFGFGAEQMVMDELRDSPLLFARLQKTNATTATPKVGQQSVPPRHSLFSSLSFSSLLPASASASSSGSAAPRSRSLNSPYERLYSSPTLQHMPTTLASAHRKMATSVSPASSPYKLMRGSVRHEVMHQPRFLSMAFREFGSNLS